MEAGRMEQIIKFRDSALSSPDAIVKYLNELDKESLINSFKEMAQRRNDILKTEHSNPET